MALDFQNVSILLSGGAAADDEQLLPPSVLTKAENANYDSQHSIARGEAFYRVAATSGATTQVRANYLPDIAGLLVESLPIAALSGAFFAAGRRYETGFGSSSIIRALPTEQFEHGAGVWGTGAHAGTDLRMYVKCFQDDSGSYGLSATPSSGYAAPKTLLGGAAYPIATKTVVSAGYTYVFFSDSLNGVTTTSKVYVAVFNGSAWSPTVDLGTPTASATLGGWDAVASPSGGCTYAKFDGTSFSTYSISTTGAATALGTPFAPPTAPLTNIALRYAPMGGGVYELLIFFEVRDGGALCLGYASDTAGASTLSPVIASILNLPSAGRVAVDQDHTSADIIVAAEVCLAATDPYNFVTSYSSGAAAGSETFRSMSQVNVLSLRNTVTGCAAVAANSIVSVGGRLSSNPKRIGPDGATPQNILLQVHRPSGFEARELLLLLSRATSSSAVSLEPTVVATFVSAPAHNLRIDQHSLPELSVLGNTVAVTYARPGYVNESTAGELRFIGNIRTQQLDMAAKYPLDTKFQGLARLAGGAPLDVARYVNTSGHPCVPLPYYVNPYIGAGGLVVGHSYWVRCTYAVMDEAGNWVESAPSSPTSVTATSGNTKYAIALLGAPLAQTTKFRVYRTVGNAAVGDTYYFDHDESRTGSEYGGVIVSGQLDADLVSQPPGYWQQEAANRPAPSCSMLCEHQGRLFASDGYGLRFTKASAPGYGAEWYNEAAGGIAAPDSLGRICWLISQSDRLVVGCERGIGVVVGSGPDDSGNGSSYSAVVPVPGSYGSVFGRHRAAASCSAGIWFASSVGMRLLGPSLDILKGSEGADLGSETDDLVAGASAVAVYRPSTTQSVYAQLLGASGSRLLLLSELSGAWTTINDQQDPSGAVTAAVDDTRIYLVTPTATLTGGYSISPAGGVTSTPTMTLETPWLKLQGLQDFQRVTRLLLLGKMKLASGGTAAARGEYIKAEVAYNYEDTWTTLVPEQKFVPIPSVDGSWGRVDFEAQLATQKCESIRFRITTHGTGADSFRIAGLTLRVGLKRGRYKKSRTPAGS